MEMKHNYKKDKNTNHQIGQQNKFNWWMNNDSMKCFCELIPIERVHYFISIEISKDE